MAPIPMKSVISATSEDPSNPARNLLSVGAGGKWLCAAGNASHTAEVVIELSKKSKITSLEISNFGSAFVEVLVSNDNGTEECTLLPSVMLMTIADSRAGRNKTKTLTASKERLSHAAMEHKWSRMKIVCRQPYSPPPVQFGLQYILVYSDLRTIAPLPTPSPHTVTPPHFNIKSPSTATPLKLPPLKPPSNTPVRTPKRTLKQNSRKAEAEDFEFHGLEKQSRLFTNAVHGRGDSQSETGNAVLERIKSDPDKYTLSPSLYQRKKLLTKDLPKADSHTDFTSSYKADSKNAEMSGACRRMSAHDNDHEIGTEPEHTWGWGSRNRKRKNSSPNSGWIYRKKKLDSMIDKCCDVISRAGSEQKTPGTMELIISSRKEPSSSEGEQEDPPCVTTGCVPDKLTETAANEGAPPELMECPANEGAPPELMECPLCGVLLPSYAIEIHASTCGELTAIVIS